MRKSPAIISLTVLIAVLAAPPLRPAERPSPRELGIVTGGLPTGPLNAITDVPGVRVGHRTIIRGDSIRTGVTAVLPHPGNLFLEKVPGAVEVFNGFGKLAGSTQVNELGTIETPIILTNTLAVPAAADGLIRHMLGLPGMREVYSINPLVAETNDWYLNDIRSISVTPEDVASAIENASGGPVSTGSVGAGTGTRCLGFKGGIGTASRTVLAEGENYTLGVLVQSNFGGSMTVGGAPVGLRLKRKSVDQGGSCIIVIATDAPLTHHGLARLARRSFAGMARIGADFSNGSGDYAIAFSTASGLRSGRAVNKSESMPRILDNDSLDPLFVAVAEATEEALLVSLLSAGDMTGQRGRTVPALDPEGLIEALGQAGR